MQALFRVFAYCKKCNILETVFDYYKKIYNEVETLYD